MTATKQTKSPETTESQMLLEELRVANLHLSNLLQMMAKMSEDNMETMVTAAIRYNDDEFAVYEKLKELAEKGGV